MADPTVIELVELAKRPAKPITGLLTNAAGNVVTGKGLLRGLAVMDTSQTGHTQLDDGRDGTGQQLLYIDWTLSPSGQLIIPGEGVLFLSGLYQTNSTALESCVWYVTLLD